MGATQPDRRHRLITAARLLPAVAAGGIAALLATALLLAGVVPALAGGRPVTVDTAGERSDLAAGALVVVRPGTPVVGDVVAVAPGRSGVRSLGVVEAFDATGAPVVSSANGAADAIRWQSVEGVYLYGVPWLGAIWSAVSTPSGMFFLAALLLLLVAAHHLRDGRRRDPRREDCAGVSAL
ncbi:hypothetical protein [Pseudonocardia sp.]|uniref:hypothetical protein n=1 Tax=Pseudonocardia sp. TaxID=60912 RepID=UPI002611F0EB|nr:hypothetical protein [Pseudonocardia sp.]